MKAVVKDVAGHDCIICEGFQAPDVWTFARGQAAMAITIRPRLVVSNVEAACDAARAGIGLTRAFSYHVASSIETGTLTTVLDEYRPAPLRGASFIRRPVLADQAPRLPRFCIASPQGPTVEMTGERRPGQTASTTIGS